MVNPAVELFKAVYRATDGSIEAAILELKRTGWSQLETVYVIEQVFSVTTAYAEQLVTTSMAWE